VLGIYAHLILSLTVFQDGGCEPDDYVGPEGEALLKKNLAFF
jgi:hypothetical protein